MIAWGQREPSSSSKPRMETRSRRSLAQRRVYRDMSHACSGPLDRSAQAALLNLLRSDTPAAFQGLSVPAQFPPGCRLGQAVLHGLVSNAPVVANPDTTNPGYPPTGSGGKVCASVRVRAEQGRGASDACLRLTESKATAAITGVQGR
jgi:hypothetical protein